MVSRDCKMCGAHFTAENPKARYCSPECSHKGKLKRSEESRARRRERYSAARRVERAQAELRKNALNEIVRRAEAAGMSYGNYVAKAEGRI